MRIKNCTILGAGIAGLTLADKLSDQGITVTIFEKEEFIGGLARRVPIDGGAVDFGPHNLRAGNPAVLTYWRDLLGPDLEARRFNPQIYFRGSLLRYPIRPFELLSKLPPATILKCGAGLLSAQARSGRRVRTPETFGDWVRTTYGGALHDEFFRPFTEKVWNLAPDELDADLGRQRIPRSTFSDLALGWLGRKPVAHSELPGATDHYYPKFGTYQLCDAIASRLKSKGVVVHTSSSVISVSESVDGLTLTTRTGSGHRTLQTDYLALTTPLPTTFGLLGFPSDEVTRALRHRGLSILFLSLPRTVGLPEAFTYCADASLPFNRITDFLQCSEHVCPPGKNVVAIEFDPRSDMPDETDMDRIVHALRSTGLLDLSVIHARRLERASVVYPVYRRGYAQAVRTALELCSRRRRVLTIGRHGTFSHVNIDQVMEQAFAASELLATDPFSQDRKAAFYFEA